MKIKEKLYKEFVIAKNKLNALRGEKLIGGNNIEEYFASFDFSNRASHHTKEEIRNMIDYANRCYEDEVEKLRIENYFNTEEGKAEKESTLARIEELTEERYEVAKRITKEVDAFIKEWLGKEWGCGLVGAAHMEIGIVEKQAEVGNTFVFGHSFSVYYNDYFTKDRFEMNYGCMGSFGLLNGSKESELRCQYLMGMATFANDKEKVMELENMLKAFNMESDRISNTIRVLNHNLKNPFNKKEMA